MGQFGKTRTINGVSMTPHVNTTCFKKETPCDLVDDLILLNSTVSEEKMRAIHKSSKETYVGKSYSLWVSDAQHG